jgi:hypothetical protein
LDATDSGVEHLMPVDDAEGADLEQQVDAHDAEDRGDDRARQGAAGVLDLGAHVRGGVVAEVVVDADGQPRREAGPEVAGPQVEGVRGVRERLVRVEVAERRRDHQHHGDDHHAPHHGAELGDVLHAPPQQRHDQGDDAEPNEVALRLRHAVPQISEVLHQSDHARGHDERDEQHRRPDEQEGHQLAAAVLEGLAQIDITVSGPGQRGAQLGPDQPVRQCQHRARQKADDGLGPAEGGDHEGDGRERPDAAHLTHVDGGGLEQPDPADESALAAPAAPAVTTVRAAPPAWRGLAERRSSGHLDLPGVRNWARPSRCAIEWDVRWSCCR